MLRITTRAPSSVLRGLIPLSSHEGRGLSWGREKGKLECQETHPRSICSRDCVEMISVWNSRERLFLRCSVIRPCPGCIGSTCDTASCVRPPDGSPAVWPPLAHPSNLDPSACSWNLGWEGFENTVLGSFR